MHNEEIVVDTASTKLVIDDSFVVREIGGETVIIPTDDSSMIGNGMLSPNETAAFLWKQFAVPRTVNEVIENCLEEYDVSEEDAASAVLDFVKQSLELNIMRRHG